MVRTIMSTFIALYQEKHTPRNMPAFTVDEGAETPGSIRQQNREGREKNRQFNWGAHMHLSDVTFQSGKKKDD